MRPSFHDPSIHDMKTLTPEERRNAQRDQAARKFVMSGNFSSYVGHEFQRVTLTPSGLRDFSPPQGWKIESIGQRYDDGATADSGRLVVTLARPLPPRPSPQNILWLVGEYMRNMEQVTLTFLATHFSLYPATLQKWLLEAGLGQPDPKHYGTGKPGFGAGRVLWLKRGRLGDPWTLCARRPRENDSDRENGPDWIPDSPFVEPF